MIKEASKMVDLAVEFCRNNLDILMIYGAVIGVFIILITIVVLAKGGDDEELDFDEIAYNKKKNKTESQEAPKEVTKVAKEVEFVSVALPPLTARVVIEEDEQAEVPEVETEEVAEVPVEEPKVEEVREDLPVQIPVETSVKQPVSRNTSCLEEIIEGLANLSADGVKKVEIKIKGAEVKITYGDDETVSLKDEPCAEDLPLEAECQDELEEVQEPVENKEEITEAKTYKKFGPDNNNVTRSGRVYSEEELQKQIRD